MSIVHARASAQGHKQRGWGLLELMVAITIGLFVIFGMFSMLYNLTVANQAQSQLSALEDNQRVVMSLLQNIVQEAGYTPAAGPSGAPQGLPAASNAYWTMAAGQDIVGTTVGSSDTITVSYYADDATVIGCLGAVNSGAVAEVFINQFSVQNNNLVCTFSINNGTVATGVVASGVASMSVLYGMDINHSVGSVDTYMTAAGVAAQVPLKWTCARSAQITVNFVNPLYNPGNGNVQTNATIPVTRTVNLMDNFVQLTTAISGVTSC